MLATAIARMLRGLLFTSCCCCGLQLAAYRHDASHWQPSDQSMPCGLNATGSWVLTTRGSALSAPPRTLLRWVAPHRPVLQCCCQQRGGELMGEEQLCSRLPAIVAAAAQAFVPLVKCRAW